MLYLDWRPYLKIFEKLTQLLEIVHEYIVSNYQSKTQKKIKKQKCETRLCAVIYAIV